MSAYTIAQVAEMAQISRDTVEREIARGNLRARKIGRVYRIPERWHQD